MKKVKNLILLFVLILVVGILFSDPKLTVLQGLKYKGETIGHITLVDPEPSRNRIIVKYCAADIVYSVNGVEYKAVGEVTQDMITPEKVSADININYMKDNPEKIMLKDINNKVVIELYAFYLGIVLILVIICKVIKLIVNKKDKKEEK